MQQITSIRAVHHMTLAESRVRMTHAAKGWLYIFAHFKHDEPIIDGVGETLVAAQRMALEAGDPRSELFRRIPGESLVWRNRRGQTLTIEHFHTVD